MPQSYTAEFKKKIVRLHLEEGRTYKSITAEYGVSKASISKWCREFSKECQTNPQTQEEYDSIVNTGCTLPSARTFSATSPEKSSHLTAVVFHL